MAFVWDPYNVLGLAFNIIILTLGYWGYMKSGNKVPLYISIAFIIFAISYIITILGLGTPLGTLIIRAIAYLIFSFAMYKLALKK